MPVHVDQLGRSVVLDVPPQRIVSLVPSQTELLYHLGLDARVTGITKFCVHPPEWFKHKTRVGGTKNIRPDIIVSLQPDLIIANKEENEKDQVEELAKHYPVWISDIQNMEQALHMIRLLGEVTDTETAAAKIVRDVQEGFAGFPIPARPKTAVYLIWKGPYMTVGADTFIHDMMQRVGYHNLFKHQVRYPEITLEQIIQLQPEYLLLSSEPYPFSRKHINDLQVFLPVTKILLVDGEMFSWYGSRMVEAARYFLKMANDE